MGSTNIRHGRPRLVAFPSIQVLLLAIISLGISMSHVVQASSDVALSSSANNNNNNQVYSLSPYRPTKDTSSSSSSDKKKSPTKPSMIENPFASGISKTDVDLLVREVMKDPDINNPLIPDILESQIYRSTIILFFNTVYESLAEYHALPLVADHCLKLGRAATAKRLSKKRIKNFYLEAIREDNFDDKTLEAVADRMLQNPAVNSWLLPDYIEKQLYLSCLKLIFRLMGMLAVSTRLSLCGHEIRMQVNKAAQTAIATSAVKRATASMTTIDTQHIEEYARHAGLDEATKKKWFFGKQRYEFTVHLYASLYGLILGIMDDLLHNTKLELLSDRVRLDVVPNDDPEIVAYRRLLKQRQLEQAAEEDASTTTASSSDSVAVSVISEVTSATSVSEFDDDNDENEKTVGRKTTRPAFGALAMSFVSGIGTAYALMAASQSGFLMKDENK